MNVRIYTDRTKREYAIAVAGDQTMRAVTMSGIVYPHLEGEYEIEAESDLAFIDESVQDALELETVHFCKDRNSSVALECCNCGGTIKPYEAHSEIVLYAMGQAIGTIATMHNDCDDAE